MDYPACIIQSINKLSDQDTNDASSASTSRKAPQKITQWHSLTSCQKPATGQERQKD